MLAKRSIPARRYRGVFFYLSPRQKLYAVGKYYTLQPFLTMILHHFELHDNGIYINIP